MTLSQDLALRSLGKREKRVERKIEKLEKRQECIEFKLWDLNKMWLIIRKVFGEEGLIKFQESPITPHVSCEVYGKIFFLPHALIIILFKFYIVNTFKL